MNITKNAETQAYALADAKGEADALADPQIPPYIDQRQLEIGIAKVIAMESGSKKKKSK